MVMVFIAPHSGHSILSSAYIVDQGARLSLTLAGVVGVKSSNILRELLTMYK